MTSRSDSESSRSPRAVEPLRSQKRMVTSLRTSCGGAGGASSAPQKPQSRNFAGFASPHDEQMTLSGSAGCGSTGVSAVPQKPQTRNLSGLSSPQPPQICISTLYEAVPRVSMARGGAQSDLQPFAGDQRWFLLVPDDLRYLVVERLELAICAHRIVVEHRELTNPGRASERGRVGDARVPPTAPVPVFLVRVLRVVQEEVGTGGDRPARNPLWLVVD